MSDPTKWTAIRWERAFDGGCVVVEQRLAGDWRYVIIFDDERVDVRSWPPFGDAEAAMAAADAQVSP